MNHSQSHKNCHTHVVNINLRLDVVRILVRAWRDFYGVAFANDAHITFQIAFWSTQKIIWIGKQSPFVVEKVICGYAH